MESKSLLFVEASLDLLPWFRRAKDFGYRCIVCGTDSSKEMARDADVYYEMLSQPFGKLWGYEEDYVSESDIFC